MRQTSSTMNLKGDRAASNGRVPSVSNHIDKYGSTANGEIATGEPAVMATGNGHAVEDTEKNLQHDSEPGKPGIANPLLSNCV